MSIIVNKGKIFVNGTIENKNSDNLDNQGDIYLGIDKVLNNTNYKISEKISDSLENLSNKLVPKNSNYWIGFNPNNFGNIWHQNNLADIDAKGYGPDWLSIDNESNTLTLKIELKNIGGKKTTGYKIGDIFYDFHALYLLTDIQQNVENTQFKGIITYQHEDNTYYLKKYIKARESVKYNFDGMYRYSNNGYTTIVQDNLSEGILTYPLLDTGDTNIIELQYNLNNLKSIINRSLNNLNSIKLLFVADDPYFYNKGDTDEIIDTNISSNNNCILFDLSFE